MYFSKKLNQINNIKHCFFSKTGGTSKGIYESLNCGLGSKDNPLDIKNNLKIVSNQMGVEGKNLILMNQTHSNKVLIVTKENNNGNRLNSDAMITQTKGLVIGVLTADCVPIILDEKKNNSVGCIHAGWKGCISGIIENTLAKFISINKDNEFFVAIGPCIGPSSYEVGVDLVRKFEKESQKNLLFFVEQNNGKFLFDIRGYINNKLKKLGINNIDNIELDTFQERNNFFSYRRSQKLSENDYGRCISTICLI